VLIYGCVVGAIAGAITLAIRSALRGAAWTKPVQSFALHLPMVGKSLRTIALARLAWTLQLTMNSAMEIRQALRLALESSGNDHFASRADQVCNAIAAGKEIHEALRATRAFPEDFLDAVEVAEHSGSLVESLERLSRQYEEQSQAATTVLATVAGFLVWALVATIIVVAIFRIAWFAYFKPISDMSRAIG
jgi:type IV pilus assembly protein PilC